MGGFFLAGWFEVFLCFVAVGFVFNVTKMLITDCLELFLSVPCSSLLICDFAPNVGMKQKFLEELVPLYALTECFKVGGRY